MNLTGILTTDIFGLARRMDGHNDGVARFEIGAYEYNSYRFEPAVHMTADGLRFTVRGEPCRSVRIERSRDLLDWEHAATVPIPTHGKCVRDAARCGERALPAADGCVVVQT